MPEERLIDAHYGFGGIWDRIENALLAAGKDMDALRVDDLAPVDAFHTRGREATVEVATLAKLTSGDCVLDVGCGLGGTGRHLAEAYGCRVTGLDLTEEYVAVGRRLTDLVGLSSLVELTQGSALAMPFEDDAFDVAWTEHVQMNIADKAGFYGEIARVLKPGGRLVFHDVFCGEGVAPVYPTPWAEHESLSALAGVKEACGVIEGAGLEIKAWQETVEESIEFFEAVIARMARDAAPPLGIHLLMGDTATEKLGNYARNLQEGRLVVAMGKARKK